MSCYQKSGTKERGEETKAGHGRGTKLSTRKEEEK